MNDEMIGLAAVAAAVASVLPGTLNIIFAKPHPDAEAFGAGAIGYIRAAPSAGPNDVLRFTAAKDLHLLPRDEEVDAHGEVGLFFIAFTGAAKGLIAQFTPRKEAPRIALSTSFGGGAGDNLYERTGEEQSRPESNAGMRVVLADPAPAMSPRGTPTLAEFQMMSPEERRAFAGAHGFPSILDDLAQGKPLIETRAPAPARVIGPDQFERDPAERLHRAPPAAQPAPAPAKGKRKR